MKQGIITSSLLAVLLLLSCRAWQPDAALSGDPAPAAPAQELGFEGQLVATEATELRAALNSFRVMGWHSYSSNIELQELVEDGTMVQAGEVVARFEFRGKRALPWIQQRIDESDAEHKNHMLEIERQRKTVATENTLGDLDAQLAALDAGAVDLLPRLDAELLAVRAEILRFEVAASQRLTAALEQEIAAETAFFDQTVAQANEQLQRYQAYEERFLLRAPHDGVVRIAYSPEHKRKLQRGDGLPCGERVLSIARDERLSVEFYVPENDIGSIDEGRNVVISSVETSATAQAVISSIDLFPREIGELRRNDQLPGGREKVLVVRADLTGTPTDLRAGSDVEVRP